MSEQNQPVATTNNNKKAPKKNKQSDILFSIQKNGRHINGWYNFIRIFILPLVRLISPFKIIGTKKVNDGACVYVSNHFSMVDPMYLMPTTKESVHFICKQEALSIPVLGFFVRRVKAIPVSRDGNDVRAVMNGLKCLKNGDKLAIYPEGRRNKVSEELQSFESGSAMLAIRAKAPIVPVVIYKRPKLFRKNYAIIGEPFELSEYYGVKLTDEILREADNKISERMKQLRADFVAQLETAKDGK